MKETFSRSCLPILFVLLLTEAITPVSPAAECEDAPPMPTVDEKVAEMEARDGLL